MKNMSRICCKETYPLQMVNYYDYISALSLVHVSLIRIFSWNCMYGDACNSFKFQAKIQSVDRKQVGIEETFIEILSL